MTGCVVEGMADVVVVEVAMPDLSLEGLCRRFVDAVEEAGNIRVVGVRSMSKIHRRGRGSVAA